MPGSTFAVTVTVLFTFTIADTGFNTMLSTGTFVVESFTVIVQEPLFVGSSTDVAVIVAVPADTAVTTPVCGSTSATAESDELHVTVLFVAS